MAVPIGGVFKAVLMLQVLLATFFHGVCGVIIPLIRYVLIT